METMEEAKARLAKEAEEEIRIKPKVKAASKKKAAAKK